MTDQLLEKYNVPVPRYTSYPPANYFSDAFNNKTYEEAIIASNNQQPGHISFYVHIPFCKHLCHYCGCNSFAMTNEKKVNEYLKAVHTEIDKVTALLDNNRMIAQIHYGGGSPTSIPVERLRELNEHMRERFQTILDPEIAIECHPGYLDESYWEALTQAGFNRISLGVQDFDEKVLKTVNRRASLLPMETIFGILRNAGVRINMDFIYGLPHQTVQSFSQTIRRAIQLQPDRLVTFSYAHVPWVNKSQLLLEKAGLPAGEEKSNMYDTARQLLKEAGYEAVGMDHFVRPDDELFTALQTKQLHRNFQGYCTRRTTGQVYAFGVTGISQLSTAYSQNIKDITAYIETINQGSFAVTKGYSLSYKEQLTREAIESLMCNGSLDWEELARQAGISSEAYRAATAYNPDRMKEFASDGLITWSEQNIQLTPKGAIFVRNVAASLDKLMLHTTKSFSKPV